MKNNLQILTNNGVLELNNWIQINQENREFSKNLIVQALETKFYNNALPIYKCYITDSVYKLVVLILHNDKSGIIEENDIIRINRIISGSTNDSSGKIAVIKNYEILYSISKEDELELSPSDTKIILSEIQRDSKTKENMNNNNHEYSRNDFLLNIKKELNSVINNRVLKQNILIDDTNSNKEIIFNPDQNNKINTLKIDTINMNTINKNKLVNKFDPNFLNSLKSNSIFNMQNQNLNLNLNSDKYLKDKIESNERLTTNETSNNVIDHFKRNNESNNRNDKPNNIGNNSISNNIKMNDSYENYSGKNVGYINSLNKTHIFHDNSIRENKIMSKNSNRHVREFNKQEKDEEEIINLLEEDDIDDEKNRNYLYQTRHINYAKNNLNVGSNNSAPYSNENNYNYIDQRNSYNSESNKEYIYKQNIQQQRLLNSNTNIPQNINSDHNIYHNKIQYFNNYGNNVNDNSRTNNYNNNYLNNSNRQNNSIIRTNSHQIWKNKKNDVSNFCIDDRFEILNSTRKTDIIKNLTTLNSQIFIRVRCLYKSEKRSYQNKTKNVFNFNVIDSEGSEMPITCFDLTCDKFYDMIEVNSVYEISGGYLKVNDKKFTRVNSDLKLYLDENTILRKLQDKSLMNLIPTQKYNFVKIEKIATLPLNKIIDILCYILEIKETKTVTSKKSNKDTILKVLRVTDDTLFKIDVSIWGQNANENYYPGQILAIRYVKVGEFKGRNLSVCDSVSMQFEPSFSEALEMREKVNKYDGVFKELPHFINEVYGIDNNGMKIINISDLVNYLNTLNVENVTLGDCVVKGSVVQMIHAEKNYYSGCPVCKKKLSIEENYFCVKCKQNYNKAVNYFHINLLIKDETGELGLDILGENAEIILAIKCDEYKEIFESNNDDKLFEISDKLEFQTYFFTLIPRITMFENKSNKRFTCVKFTKIDKDDSTRLKEIDNYCSNRLFDYHEDLNEISFTRNNNYKSFISRGNLK